MLNVEVFRYEEEELSSGGGATTTTATAQASSASAHRAVGCRCVADASRCVADASRRRIRVVLACALRQSLARDRNNTEGGVNILFSDVCTAMCVDMARDSSTATLAALSADGLYLSLLDRRGQMTQRVTLPMPMCDFAACLVSPKQIPCTAMTVSMRYASVDGPMFVLVCARSVDVEVIERRVSFAARYAPVTALTRGEEEPPLLKVLKRSANGLRLGFDQKRLPRSLRDDAFATILAPPPSFDEEGWSSNSSHRFLVFTLKVTGVIVVLDMFMMTVHRMITLPNGLHPVSLSYESVSPLSRGDFYNDVVTTTPPAARPLQNKVSSYRIVVAASTSASAGSRRGGGGRNAFQVDEQCILSVDIVTGKCKIIDTEVIDDGKERGGPASQFTAIPPPRHDDDGTASPSDYHHRFAVAGMGSSALFLVDRLTPQVEPSFVDEGDANNHQLLLNALPASLQLLHNGYLAMCFFTKDDVCILDLDSSRRKRRIAAEGNRPRYGDDDGGRGWIVLKLQVPSARRLGLTVHAEGHYGENRVRNAAWLDL